MQQTYVGRFTAGDLKWVAQGVTSLEALRSFKRLHDSACKTDPSHRNADYEISLHETLSILEPLEERTTKALITTLYDYQAMLTDIERCPERYATKYLTPEMAKAWYSSQIAQIRRLLQQH